MKPSLVVPVLLGLVLVDAVHAQAYKCSVEGKLVYQQVPCQAGKQIQLPAAVSAAQGPQLVRLVEVKNANVCTQEAALVFAFNVKSEGFYVLELVFQHLDMNTSLSGTFSAGPSTHQINIPHMRRVQLTEPIASLREVRFSRYGGGVYATLAEIRDLKLPRAIQPC